MQTELQSLLTTALALPVEQLATLLGELEAFRFLAYSRLSSPPAQCVAFDEQLGIAEAARRLGVSKGFLYQNHRSYSFTRREGGKLLFSARGIEAYISRKDHPVAQRPPISIVKPKTRKAR